LAQHQAVITLGLEHTDAEASLVPKGKTKVSATVKLYLLDVLSGGDRQHQVFGIRCLQLWAIDRSHATAQTQARRHANLQV